MPRSHWNLPEGLFQSPPKNVEVSLATTEAQQEEALGYHGLQSHGELLRLAARLPRECSLKDDALVPICAGRSSLKFSAGVSASCDSCSKGPSLYAIPPTRLDDRWQEDPG
ncbi:hypothetical protein VSDG_03794 [Cytospora chrysosperma]|uniref:Uncharacterized protein n=1 Tax=Cytospora chrysosperma TaxID=252740 RepID=A0A423W6Q5_CYTCH|nr:hypothetical protein VSDG_03794 [Valsa sordida]